MKTPLVLMTSTFAVFVAFDAGAQPAPNVPLPPCEMIDGAMVGACPRTSPVVSIASPGRFGAGQTLDFHMSPTIGACDTWDIPLNIWTPSPCYVSVHSLAIGLYACFYIDPADGVFKSGPCDRVLYKDDTERPPGLFSFASDYYDGPDAPTLHMSCGAAPDFSTYFYGAPGSDPNWVWSARGPMALNCRVTFEGPRPDGLLGPTWIRVTGSLQAIASGERATTETAEVFVPIDGDLRERKNLRIEGDVVVDDSLGTARFTVDVFNTSEEEITDVDVAFTLPRQLVFYEATAPGTRCGRPRETLSSVSPAGGISSCDGITVPPMGSVRLVLTTRITNASDLEPLIVTVDPGGRIDEASESDNTVELKPRQIFFPAAHRTEEEMVALRAAFDYQTALHPFSSENACTNYAAEIFERLVALRASRPELFENLSFGRVTDGKLAPTGGLGDDFGHDGVVVYFKGSDYHESGRVIHGVAAPSRYGVGTWFTQHYVETPIWYWQSNIGVRQAGHWGTFFEGPYPSSTEQHSPITQPCLLAPDVVVVSTGSPIDLRITNSSGQRVQTQRTEVVVNELDGGLHAYDFPKEEDGTTEWTLVLPIDHYDIEIVGNGDGPYTLTLTTFDEYGMPVDEVHTGTAAFGRTETFVLEGAQRCAVDADRDGVCDEVDNCDRPNIQQLDADENGVGDVCEVVPESEEGGCGCSQTSGRSAWSALLLIGLLGALRVRRSAPRR